MNKFTNSDLWLFIGVIIFICSMFIISYALTAVILKVVFWAFGGTLFGYHYSLKLVLGIWLIWILIGSMLKRTSK